MGIVRPVMQVYPAAWEFFVPFVVITTFTMLNLFIAFLVSATQSQQQSEKENEEIVARPFSLQHEDLVEQISFLRRELAELRTALESRREGDK